MITTPHPDGSRRAPPTDLVHAGEHTMPVPLQRALDA